MAKAPSSQSNPTSSFNREKRGGFLLYTPEVAKKLAKLAKSGNDPVLTQLEKLANTNPKMETPPGDHQTGSLFYLSGGHTRNSLGVLFIHDQSKKMPLTVVDLVSYGDMMNLRLINPTILKEISKAADKLVATYSPAPDQKGPEYRVYRPRKGLQPSV